ncbi:hypothetical protein BDM02DRAFT_3123115 [Thelephora ganbajun]|uniref:Uncharacterized protein n=1 Tax=Thelephora ganbajun TaxID=370292 RepID=A0ACB6Z281_THEGA|nr:hypothetical protein BDM02DRAFT_3123115 [Thelephora ganbajun]
MSLFSYAYTNEVTFSPLRTSIDSDYVADAEVQRPQLCSPRSVYSLAATVGILCGYTVPSADTLNSLGSRISKRKH